MEQLSLFEPIFKDARYIIDASSIMNQKLTEPYRRNVHKTLWKNIEELINQKIIVTCSEVRDELKDEDIIDWIKRNGCYVIDIDDEIQSNVITIVNTYTKLLDFSTIKSSGDAFLIATAKKYKLTVITEEKKRSEKKIPYVCEQLSIDCINILELCEREDWQF